MFLIRKIKLGGDEIISFKTKSIKGDYLLYINKMGERRLTVEAYSLH